jgi:hypothetical protein
MYVVKKILLKGIKFRSSCKMSLEAIKMFNEKPYLSFFSFFFLTGEILYSITAVSGLPTLQGS